MVPQRVQAFRRLFPEGFISTEILSMDSGVVVMKTEVGYYDGDRRIVLGTGMAYEKEANGYVNRTSYIENCETSSVGRALGFLALGIDGGGICSAEELVNAVNNQAKNPAPMEKSMNGGEQTEQNSTANLAEIRNKLEWAIKNRTKGMDRNGKIEFINNIIAPTLNGERNWKLCCDSALLMKLLKSIEQL